MGQKNHWNELDEYVRRMKKFKLFENLANFSLPPAPMRKRDGFYTSLVKGKNKLDDNYAHEMFDKVSSNIKDAQKYSGESTYSSLSDVKYGGALNPLSNINYGDASSIDNITYGDTNNVYFPEIAIDSISDNYSNRFDTSPIQDKSIDDLVSPYTVELNGYDQYNDSLTYEQLDVPDSIYVLDDLIKETKSKSKLENEINESLYGTDKPFYEFGVKEKEIDIPYDNSLSLSEYLETPKYEDGMIGGDYESGEEVGYDAGTEDGGEGGE